ncbi:hypothetical protein HanXRQr2_Chr12g0536061 [Helianthus annuus]|uniref:Uncharacterized protein n=1 Tax=Helianthus annuus TaxID=4232 RepID=A0A9K3MVN7_HELAN|nr:hypothetical protein HanXRQr2_Chr12g0536061 [Helianthus annuus]KAJ0492671.1 hypothetical protein HanIR_Chr12g0577491 [Helianthus annuus]KAJ0862284.1 hypothetical protein HanPSC8_Chr12g0516351 [Helianthus annuus]
MPLGLPSDGNKKKPSQDHHLEDRFAKMRLTPSDEIPLPVYTKVKKAVDIMSGPKEASSYLDDLERAEYGIRVATKVYRCFLPLGWKYDRESASFFITGYDKIYTRKDGKKIIMRLAS